MESHKLLGYCGGSCSTCQIYTATRETDKEKQAEVRIEIASFASEHYDTIVKPEDITDCDGCRTPSGRLFSGVSECVIMPCVKEKGYETCADCTENPCDKLQKS